jgi:hypothetical protein
MCVENGHNPKLRFGMSPTDPEESNIPYGVVIS